MILLLCCQAQALLGVEYGYRYNLDQSVEGFGFMRSYQLIRTQSVADFMTPGEDSVQRYKATAHGSGAYAADALHKAEQKFSCSDCERLLSCLESCPTGVNCADPDCERSALKKLADDTSEIKAEENISAAYAPHDVALGSFRAIQESRWSSSVESRSEEMGIYLGHRFDHASSLSAGTKSSLHWSSGNPTGSYEVQADLNGTAKLKIVRKANELSPAVWDVADRYLGQISIYRKVDFMGNDETTQVEEDWIPCCYTGFGGMEPGEFYSYWGTGSKVFNCSC
jgi:hypothetical protein